MFTLPRDTFLSALLLLISFTIPAFAETSMPAPPPCIPVVADAPNASLPINPFDELGKAYSIAINSNDVAAIKALFPADGSMETLTSCRQGSQGEKAWTAGIRSVKRDRFDLIEKIQPGERFYTSDYEFVASNVRERVEYSKGDHVGSDKEEGCTATRPLEFAYVKFMFTHTNKKGEPDTDKETMRLIKIDNKWLILKD